MQEEKETIKQDAVDDQNLLVTADVALRNDIVTDSSAVASETLRHRRSSSQLRATSITSTRNDNLELASHRYSWELIFIWFFSVIIIGLILRRLFFVQNSAVV